jgi:hypothetical protein
MTLRTDTPNLSHWADAPAGEVSHREVSDQQEHLIIGAVAPRKPSCG